MTSDTGSFRPLRIAPVGSCRIATPLRLGQPRHGYMLERTRVYGFCHSPAEALQLARFLRGEATPPPDLWPYIGRGTVRDALVATPPDMADIHFVEISSAKDIRIGETSVQLNYLVNAHAGFFANVTCARRFWELASEGSQGQIDRHLRANGASKAEARMLSRVRLWPVTDETLRADLADLMRLLTRPVFVTHVDARRPDGNVLESRSGFIARVERAVGSLGGQVFNPTALMQEWGQHAALSDPDTGLAHYTDDFALALADRWVRDFIDLAEENDANAPRTASGAQQDDPRFSRGIDPETRSLQATLWSDPQPSPEKETIAEVRDGMSKAFEMKRFDVVCAYVTQLRAAKAHLCRDEIALAADAAAAAEDAASAARLARIALGLPAAADRLAPCLVSLLLADPHADIGAAMSELSVSRDVLLDIFTHVQSVHGDAGTIRLLRHWWQARMVPGMRDVAHRLLAASLAEDGQLLAHDGLILAEIILSADGAPRRLPATHRHQIGQLARTFHLTENSDAMAALAELCAKHGDVPAEVALSAARLGLATQDHATALHFGGIALRRWPEKIDLLVLMMRAAERSGNAALRHRYARDIETHATPQHDKARREAAASKAVTA